MQIPEEVEKIDEKLEHLARVMEDTVDLDGILELARNVSAMQEDTQVKRASFELIRHFAKRDSNCSCT